MEGSESRTGLLLRTLLTFHQVPVIPRLEQFADHLLGILVAVVAAVVVVEHAPDTVVEVAVAAWVAVGEVVVEAVAVAAVDVAVGPPGPVAGTVQSA